MLRNFFTQNKDKDTDDLKAGDEINRAAYKTQKSSTFYTAPDKDFDPSYDSFDKALNKSFVAADGDRYLNSIRLYRNKEEALESMRLNALNASLFTNPSIYEATQYGLLVSAVNQGATLSDIQVLKRDKFDTLFNTLLFRLDKEFKGNDKVKVLINEWNKGPAPTSATPKLYKPKQEAKPQGIPGFEDLLAEVTAPSMKKSS